MKFPPTFLGRMREKIWRKRRERRAHLWRKRERERAYPKDRLSCAPEKRGEDMQKLLFSSGKARKRRRRGIQEREHLLKNFQDH